MSAGGEPAPAAIRRQLAACLTALAREHCAHAAGRSNLRTAAIFSAHADLLERATFAHVEDELARAAGAGDREEARRLGALRAGLAHLAVEGRAAPLADELAAAPHRASSRLHKDRLLRAHAAARALGHDCYEDFFTKTSGIDLDRIVSLLAPLRPAASARLAALVRPEEDLRQRFRAVRFDPWFPADSAVPRARRIVERDLGLDLAAGGRLHLDLEPQRVTARGTPPAAATRHGAAPRGAASHGAAPHGASSHRPFTAAIAVPAEIRLVVRPDAGADAHAAFFHELGHALHLAHVDPALAWEDRHLGDRSVSEGFAALFEGILREPPFAERHVAGEAAAYLDHASFVQLWMLCRYAAKLDYERELWRRLDAAADEASRAAALDRMPDRYVAHLMAATRQPVVRDHAFSDLELHFEAASHLRGWLLTAILRRALRADFGDAWFESRRAGRRLREIWAYGHRWNAEELARELGADGLDPEPLRAEIEIRAPPRTEAR